MAILTFQVQNQQMRRTDSFYVVAESQNYLYASFSFSADWGTGTKTAQFRNPCVSSKTYEVILDQNNTCLVPWEVISTHGTVEVTVFGGDLITTNTARFIVHESGYDEDAESGSEPTPSVYQQIIDRMDGIEADMDEATAEAKESALNAAEKAQEASESARTAVTAAEATEIARSQAVSAANDAEDAETAAGQSASEAKASETAAKTAMENAAASEAAAVQAKEDAESALATIQGLVDGLQELTLAMEDTSGNEVIVKVLGRTVT